MDDSVQAALFLGSICTSVPVRVYSIESLYVYIIPGTIYIYRYIIFIYIYIQP